MLLVNKAVKDRLLIGWQISAPLIRFVVDGSAKRNVQIETVLAIL